MIRLSVGALGIPCCWLNWSWNHTAFKIWLQYLFCRWSKKSKLTSLRMSQLLTHPLMCTEPTMKLAMICGMTWKTLPVVVSGLTFPLEFFACVPMMGPALKRQGELEGAVAARDGCSGRE